MRCATGLRSGIQGGRAVGWATASKIWGVRLVRYADSRPPRQQAGPLPLSGGVRYSAQPIYSGRAMGYEASLGDSRGACGWVKRVYSEIRMKNLPRQGKPWPSPPRGVRWAGRLRPKFGGVRTAGEVYSESKRKNPPRQLTLALSPFQGACVIPLRQFIQGRAMGYGTSLGDSWGVRWFVKGVYSEI